MLEPSIGLLEAGTACAQNPMRSAGTLLAQRRWAANGEKDSQQHKVVARDTACTTSAGCSPETGCRRPRGAAVTPAHKYKLLPGALAAGLHDNSSVVMRVHPCP